MAYNNPAQRQPQVQYPAPIVYYAAPTITYQAGPNYGAHYARQASTGLGATQIVLACVSIAAGVMADVYDAGLYYVGIGIWGGFLYLIAGSLAISAGNEPKNSLITATLVFSIVDILCGVAQITVASYGIDEDINHYCDPYYGYYDCVYSYSFAITANSMMIGVGTLEIIFGIALTAICSRAIDKGSWAQRATFPVASAPPTHPETLLIQSQPALQSQPPPYYAQSQYPSTSNPPQIMRVGVHQAPPTTKK